MNLNRADYAINEIDNRVIRHDTEKANKSEILNLVNGWTMDEKTGIITVTKVNGERIIFDLNIEKIPVGFSLSPDGILTMATSDGTKFTANIGAMIPVLEFQSTDTISVSVQGEGVKKSYKFEVKNGSITADKLQPDYLADVTVQASNASAAATAAADSAKSAKDSEIKSSDFAKKSENFASLSESFSQSALDSKNAAVDAKEKAVSASNNATSMVEDVEEKINNGYFQGPQGERGPQGPQGIQGPKGEKGDKGERGDNGVIAPISGFFILSVDDDGNLWAYSANGETIPDFEYDSTTGNLYLKTEVI